MSFLSAEDKNFDEFCEQVLKYLQLKEEIEYGLRKVMQFTFHYFLFVFFSKYILPFFKNKLKKFNIISVNQCK